MSFTYPQTANAARVAEDQRRTTRTIVFVIIIIIIILVVTIIVYAIIAARNSAATAASSNTPGTTTAQKCTTSSQCPSTSPICNTTTGLCVECTAASHAACGGNKPVCQDSTQSCVQCMVSTDCASCGVCNSQNVCVGAVLGVPTMTSFTSVAGNNCTNYDFSAAWTAVIGATSYDLFLTATDDQSGTHSASISGIGGTSIVNGALSNNIPGSWCAGFNVFLTVRAHNACGTSAFSSARQLGGDGAGCC